MEVDRGAVLTVRAAVRGVVDFSQSRILDIEWWRRTNILIRGMVKEDDLVLQQGVMAFHLALVSNSGLTEESFGKSQDNARNSFYDVVGLLRPWEGSSAAERKAREYSDLRQAYVDAFGDPSDPQWQAEQAAAIEAWREQSKKAVVKEEDEWGRIERLRRAQIDRMAAMNRGQRPRWIGAGLQQAGKQGS